jgi:transcriptional regulator with XRE-family HTH domain
MSDIFRDWSFGGQLRDMRLSRGIAMREMARMLKMDCGNYSKIEMSKLPPPPSKTKILALTKLLNPKPVEIELMLVAAYNFHQGRMFDKFWKK